MKQACRLLEVPCGGGHRAWDICFHGDLSTVVYIKSGQIVFGEAKLKADTVIPVIKVHNSCLNLLAILINI